MEQEPVAHLNLPNGEVFEATRERAQLFKHLGQLALYDHIFCYDVQDNEVRQSFYIFKDVEGYDELEQYMLDNAYPMHLNLLEVQRNDQEAYERHALRLRRYTGLVA